MASTGTTIQKEIDRLKKAKSDIKTAIINKGGTISDTATIDTYASAIDGISTGGVGVPIVFYSGIDRTMVAYPSSKLPDMYSTKENYFPILGATPPKDAFILRAGASTIQIYPYILPELPKDGTFKLYNHGDINVTSGTYVIPGIYIIHKDYSTTLYKPTNFELKAGATLKSGSYLEYTGIDFSDCIMIGIGVGISGIFWLKLFLIDWYNKNKTTNYGINSVIDSHMYCVVLSYF